MIPSRPLNFFEILHETFRIVGKIFLRTLVLVLIFVLPFAALVIWAESDALQNASHLLETQGNVTDSAFTAARDDVVRQIEEQDPESMSRLRTAFNIKPSTYQNDTVRPATPPAVAPPATTTPQTTPPQASITIHTSTQHKDVYSIEAELAGSFFKVSFALLLLALGLSGAYAGITELSARAFEERKVNFRPVLRSVFRRHLWIVFAYQMLMFFALGLIPLLLRVLLQNTSSVGPQFLSFGLSVAQVYLGFKLALSIPAIVSEEIGIAAGMKRSWQLTTSNWWRVLGIILAFGVGMFMISVIVLIIISLFDLNSVFDLFRYLFFAPQLSIHRAMQAMIEIITFAAEIYSVPMAIIFILLPIFSTVFYYDLRTRFDGPLSYDEEPGVITN